MKRCLATRRVYSLDRRQKPDDIVFSVIASVPNTYEALSIQWVDHAGNRTIPVPCLFTPLGRHRSDALDWITMFFMCWVGQKEIYDSPMRTHIEERQARRFRAVLSDRRCSNTEDLKVWTRL